jgi:hypothetical protein|tara:strand:- start:421 stop:606 length:186 start_codon:yes stop_codon:yes gene_type:complete
MEFLTENVVALFDIVTRVVGIAAIIATLTPNESDNKIIGFISRVVNVLGANVGRATNDPNA